MDGETSVVDSKAVAREGYEDDLKAYDDCDDDGEEEVGEDALEDVELHKRKYTSS